MHTFSLHKKSLGGYLGRVYVYHLSFLDNKKRSTSLGSSIYKKRSLWLTSLNIKRQYMSDIIPMLSVQTSNEVQDLPRLSMGNRADMQHFGLKTRK